MVSSGARVAAKLPEPGPDVKSRPVHLPQTFAAYLSLDRGSSGKGEHGATGRCSIRSPAGRLRPLHGPHPLLAARPPEPAAGLRPAAVRPRPALSRARSLPRLLA